ncbi:MAG: mechanosensitive ion channel family protein [Lautropia sp.]
MDSDTVDELAAAPQLATQTVQGWIDGFFRLLPAMAVALILVLLFFGVAFAVRVLVRRTAMRRERSNLGEVLGSFAFWLVAFFGIMIGLTIVLPSLKPGNLISALGFGSVAIGFAFKDILQNWLAGLLILLRQPFRTGDQIVVGTHEGTIERIETRACLIRTYDGRRVIIPNADVYSSSVIVNTAFPLRRTSYAIGIGYGDDIGRARDTMLQAIRSVDGVEASPAPEVLVDELAPSWVSLNLRWWTQSRRADVVHVRSAVIEAVKRALDAAGIDMPFETQVHLFHDQSEEVDGRRGQQREGWPRPRDREPPRPRAAITREATTSETR